MTDVEGRRASDEQLLVLWTLLLDGYVPVAHTVADVDELEAFASNESDAGLRVDFARCVQLADKNAA